MDSDDPVATTEGGAKDRNFVTALARGLDVLRCYRPNETALSNTEFAERTGLPKATVSRLTHTLCCLGYLVADDRSGSYRLGVGVLRLGYGVLAGIDICERAQQVLTDLRNGPNSYITSALGEAHELDVIYVAVHRSREEVSLAAHVGTRLPLFLSAVGRSILVAMPEATREAHFELIARRRPRRLEACRCSFERALAEYREKGFVSSYGDWRPDVNGIAVPVLSLDGTRVYGLNVGGPSFHVKKRQLEAHYAPKLIESAEFLSLRS